MNWTQYQKTTDANARHLAEVRSFTLSGSLLGPGGLEIYERRAIFYLDPVEWNDHPWGKNDDEGAWKAAFQHQWALESRKFGERRFARNGRNPGWESLRRITSGGNFDTWEEAEEERLARIDAFIEQKTEEIKFVRARHPTGDTDPCA
ncbi:hypothetical protein LCGC14_1123790 [marine sediment metagenome]|uniref:Uncharacterized protein n=1 Tax=marine sediment metagenome TaxID=412755 RepID=A0A0F9Q936_9ZZZZ